MPQLLDAASKVASAEKWAFKAAAGFYLYKFVYRVTILGLISVKPTLNAIGNETGMVIKEAKEGRSAFKFLKVGVKHATPGLTLSVRRTEP